MGSEMCIRDRCIHPNNNTIVTSHIRTNDGKISSGERLKILGFTFNSEPNANLHVSELADKLYKKLWSLRFLKRSGMGQDKLLTVYKSIIRPTADYCSVVYNSIIPGYTSEKLEKVQRHAMRIIYGNEGDIGEIMERKGIETLKNRRDKKCLDFALKAANSDRFGKKWFVESNSERNVRETTRRRYVEKRCKNERTRNNPIHFLTRLLNEHERNTVAERIEN